MLFLMYYSYSQQFILVWFLCNIQRKIRNLALSSIFPNIWSFETFMVQLVEKSISLIIEQKKKIKLDFKDVSNKLVENDVIN